MVRSRTPRNSKVTHAGDHSETRVAVDDGTVTSVSVLVIVVWVESVAKVGVELDKSSGRESEMLRWVQ